MDPLPIRWQSAAILTGPEVRGPATPFAASGGQRFGGNNQEETQREVRYSFQAFKRPTLPQVGQSMVDTAKMFALSARMFGGVDAKPTPLAFEMELWFDDP
jgi:hypothetical protein